MDTQILADIQKIIESPHDRPTKAARIAEIIRQIGPYRWVGFYDVMEDEIAVFAWSGPGAPSYPRFPRSQGLCGAAESSGATVNVGDVTKDPRYLTTLGSTRSEIVVPVPGPPAGAPVGLIDVESERQNAFADRDRALLEQCAAAMSGLWAS